MVLFFRRVTPVKKMKPALGIPPVAEVVNRFGVICDCPGGFFCPLLVSSLKS